MFSAITRTLTLIHKIGYCTRFASAIIMTEPESKLSSLPSADVPRKKPRYDGRFKKRQWEDNRRNETGEKRPCLEGDRIKRRKSIILLSYSGVNYYGMQRNPEMKTIEEDLLNALRKTNLITDEAFTQVQTIGFQRAARTDKGVSAARQVVSLKLPDEVDIVQINSNLPEQIRVFACKRVTKGFNSKTQCDARTYIYMLPTFAFAQHDEKVDELAYRITPETFKTVCNVLKLYEGAKNFHNFTSRKEFVDPSSRRYIMSFECGEPFVTDNMEFAVIKVKGQSFMMHQIRKMIGLMLAVVRGLTTVETIDRSWTDEKLDLPMAPGLGLMLDQVHYDRYNERYGTDGIHEALTWEKENHDIDMFVNKHIYPTIVSTEIKEKSMALWLETLSLHSYDARGKHRSESESEPNTPREKTDSEEDKVLTGNDTTELKSEEAKS